jgi:hypothetical protein
MNARIPLPSVLTVASWPALSRTMTVEVISWSERAGPVLLDGHQPRDEVVGRCGPFVDDQLADVVHELRGGAVRRLLLRLARAELVHLDDGV